MEDVNMTTPIGESEESLEVADPETSSVEEEEVAELPVKTERDAAFAEMRRRAESAERRVQELETGNRGMSEALGLFFNGETPDDQIAEARAYHENRPVSEVKAEMEAMAKNNAMLAENESLKNQLTLMRAEQAMAADLIEIQSIDPEIKSLADLGDTYADLIANGVDAKTAYYAAKARMEQEHINLPKTAGRVNSSSPTKEFFTREEVEANRSNPEWMSKNHDKIRSSMAKWK